MKPEQERLMTVLKDTITLLCKNSLSFEKQLVIQGLICISVDKEDVLVVQVNDNVGESSHDPCLSCGHVSNPRPTIKPPDNRKRPRTPDPDSELPSPSKSSRSDDIDDDDSNLENDYKLLPIKKEEVIEDDDDEDLVLIGEELAKHSTTPTLTGTSNQIYNHENSFNSNENSFISGFMQGTPSQINATASASQADNATAPEGWDQNLMQGSASGSEPAMNWALHVKVMPDGTTTCVTCGKCYRTENSCKTHVTAIHLRPFRFRCPFCPAQFSYKHRLKSHMQLHLQTARSPHGTSPSIPAQSAQPPSHFNPR